MIGAEKRLYKLNYRQGGHKRYVYVAVDEEDQVLATGRLALERDLEDEPYAEAVRFTLTSMEWMGMVLA